ncbi:MAG: arginine repressor [Clostridia bacterium]|jgi:transcriptional regulator of arginine metabolism|nr:arginine repressor [Clostridia bacterium]
MKSERQSKILELVKNSEFVTQEELQSKLCELGYKVTQATVSRDIRELGLIKTEGTDGVYKYRAASEVIPGDNTEKYRGIMQHAAISVANANNLVVLKTYAGMGSAAGAAVDSMNFEDAVGTLAGDDTLLIIARDERSAAKITSALAELIG